MKYRVLVGSTISDIKAGDIVYRGTKPDYGIASQDSRVLGYECVSVSRFKDGGYPLVSIPRKDLERIDD